MLATLSEHGKGHIAYCDKLKKALFNIFVPLFVPLLVFTSKLCSVYFFCTRVTSPLTSCCIEISL